MNLDRGADQTIDESLVPDSLHPLIPYVERWGFSESEIQDEFVARMVAERPSETEDFRKACDTHHPGFLEWLRAMPAKHLDQMNQADRDHPLWAFCNAYSVRELLPMTEAEANDPAQVAADERTRIEVRQLNFQDAMLIARSAFSKSDYATFVTRLEQFEDLLSPAETKKLEYARRRQSEEGFKTLDGDA